MNIKKAFTMAEILISLTIIGIVAALVLPGLTDNTTSKQFLVTFKKSLSVVNQAVDTNYALSGLDFAGNRENFNTIVGEILTNRLGADLEEGVNWTISGSGGFDSNCTGEKKGFAKEGDKCIGNVKSFKVGSAGTSVYSFRDGLASLILLGSYKDNGKLVQPMPCKSDGQRMAVPVTPGSSDNRFTYSSDGIYCLAYLDVNGPKGPNRIISCVNGLVNGGKISQNVSASGCIISADMVVDVFPVLIYGDTVVPATPAGWAVFREQFSE